MLQKKLPDRGIQAPSNLQVLYIGRVRRTHQTSSSPPLIPSVQVQVVPGRMPETVKMAVYMLQAVLHTVMVMYPVRVIETVPQVTIARIDPVVFTTQVPF